MTVTDELLDNNEKYAAAFDQGDLAMPPSKEVAVVACMDARLDVYRILGLGLGEAHVIRNAGGVISEDTIRSLVISQRLLGTREIIIVNHRDCGMLTFRDDEVKDQITEELGHRPSFALEAFSDPEQNVRHSIIRLRESPFIANKDQIRGFVFDVKTGRLEETDA